MKNILKDINVNSVCQSAKCPNIGECFGNDRITFMILGDICTRNCSFCAVIKGQPNGINYNEPLSILKAVIKLEIKHVVITSVTRDDLEDGGAGQFIEVIKTLRSKIPSIIIEILTPDFKGNEMIVKGILEHKPNIFNHNIETVKGLYSKVRPKADYNRSLKILKFIKSNSSGIIIKSGLMVGFGETIEELKVAFSDLKDHGCEIVTIGQYLRPSKEQMEVVEYISPEKFETIKELAESFQFQKVFAGPFVRSSYKAEEVLLK